MGHPLFPGLVPFVDGVFVCHHGKMPSLAVAGAGRPKSCFQDLFQDIMRNLSLIHIYTVTVPQDALLLASDDEQTPSVIDALTKRFYVNEVGILQKVEYDFSSSIELTLRVEFS